MTRPVLRRPVFTLVLVVSADGFIARTPTQSPQSWASPEEQALFFQEVEAADWAIMGRRTHEAADKPHRRRIIFSAAAGGGEWRRPTQLWLSPEGLKPVDLATRVAHVRPLRAGLILGGTRVHDWFQRAAAIDIVKLTIEPVTFGDGLPIFTGQTRRDPLAVMMAAGFHPRSERVLNAAGTRHLILTPERP